MQTVRFWSTRPWTAKAEVGQLLALECKVMEPCSYTCYEVVVACEV
uniref:Uncharacterized protein n=1 Tax=Arundo donax TaxID=35708 RepID=A0A0A9HSI8_ARUDO